MWHQSANEGPEHMSFQHRMQGITLLELMVVVVIVAILATIATANYRSYMIRTNRTEARTALLQIQSAQEKFFLQNNQYTNNITATPPDGLGLLATTRNGHYSITIDNYSTVAYRAVATAAGSQVADIAACRTLTINQNGQRTPSDSSGCWR
jgi:type IV pilus assembly protein PilE